MARPLAPGSFEQLQTSASECVRWLVDDADLWHIELDVVLVDRRWTIIDALLHPPPELCDYPIEHVRISVTSDRRVFTVPVNGDTRPWLHRYWHPSTGELLTLPLRERLTWENLLGALCLLYPEDPNHLRWNWRQGFDSYIRLVQRHLWSEEYWRRHGNWPSEDAPHGRRPDGRPHPILTKELRIA